MTAPRARHGTGDPTLDQALGGGLSSGLVVLRCEEGAGAAEFALGILRAQIRRNIGERALHVSALRASERIRQEMAEVFDDEKSAAATEFRRLAPRSLDLFMGPVGWAGASTVVLETAASIGPLCPGGDIANLAPVLSDFAAGSGALFVLLCGDGTLDPSAQARLEEAADGVLAFRWRHGGTMSRRLLQIVKLRGLPPAIEGDGTPVFEIALRRGVGVLVSRVTNVV